MKLLPKGGKGRKRGKRGKGGQKQKIVVPLPEKDTADSVRLVAEEAEDMYTLYNLIAVGDSIRMMTQRKVVKDIGRGREKSSKMMNLMLTIELEKIDFDTDVNQLRLSGKNTEENEHVAFGIYHTMILEPNRVFTLTKEVWDVVYLDQLDESCNPEKRAEVAAIVMEPGLAHICLITGHMTLVKGRIEKKMPRGHNQNVYGQKDKALMKFFEKVYTAFAAKIDVETVKCILLGSPGKTKNAFLEFAQEQAVKRDHKNIVKAKRKFLLCTTTSGHKHALDEALMQPDVQNRLSDTKAAKDIAALKEFRTLLGNNDHRACYGYDHLVRANEAAAIEKLMVTDTLFRNRDLQTRKKYVNLVEDVKKKGASGLVLSSMHASGRALDQLCMGICAILRFPLYDEDIEESNDKTKKKNNDNKKTGTATTGKGAKKKNVTSGNNSSSKVKPVTSNEQAAKAAKQKKKQAANKKKQQYGNDTFGGGDDYYDDYYEDYGYDY